MSEDILKALTIIEEEKNRTEKDIEIIRQAKKEIERLYSIIKEVREYIEENKAQLPLRVNNFLDKMVYSDEVVLTNKLLKILDKVEEK